MYGTVTRMHLKPGSEAQFKAMSDEYRDLKIPGFRQAYIYKMDANPNEIMMAVVFDDKASYHANAASPDQDARFRKMRELLASDPEWHDGEVIATME